jgi:hypothetical protein
MFKQTFRTISGWKCMLMFLMSFGFSFWSRGALQLTLSNNVPYISVRSGKSVEWVFEKSTDLQHWTTMKDFGGLLGDASSSFFKPLPSLTERQVFWRARASEGLFDQSILRTLHLTFADTNLWYVDLTAGHSTGKNTEGVFHMENGPGKYSVGARFRGYTTFNQGGLKKSINLEFGPEPESLMGVRTLNLSRGRDPILLKEALYFTAIQPIAMAPRTSFGNLYINNQNWGPYVLVEQHNKEMLQRWFSNTRGDRWRTGNSIIQGLAYRGTNLGEYRFDYVLQATDAGDTNLPWQRLLSAITALNLQSNTNELSDDVAKWFAVDRWLWFLAAEMIFCDEDGYFMKGSDYQIYFDPTSAQFHPLQHDGTDVMRMGYFRTPPFPEPGSRTDQPLTVKLLSVNHLRERYLAHCRTILQDIFTLENLQPLITRFQEMTLQSVIEDPYRSFSMAHYTNEHRNLSNFVYFRRKILFDYPDMTRKGPEFTQVTNQILDSGNTFSLQVKASLQGSGSNGVGAVYLHVRTNTYGRFTRLRMETHELNASGGAQQVSLTLSNLSAGLSVQYYLEATDNTPKATATFSPPYAEWKVYSCQLPANSTQRPMVVINELMAANSSTMADPQGEFDDWIELRNLADQEVDLSGKYLSDDLSNPRKWQFPAGTTIPAGGYLMIWADEDGADTPGLHASFKLSASGESVYLIDSDANQNSVLDSITFGTQIPDISFGRSSENLDSWRTMSPSPGKAN